MTFILFISESLRKLVRESNYFGYPCLLSNETQLLEGFLTRKDILTSLGIFKIHVFMYIIINYYFILLELIDARRDEDITEESRVFFLDKSHRLQEAIVDGDIPSVNIRGTIDPVRGREGGRREGEKGEGQ